MKYSGMTFTNGMYCPNVTFDSNSSYRSMDHVYSMGTNSVAIIVEQYQMTHNSTKIFPIYNDSVITKSGERIKVATTAKPDALISIINYAHALGMKVMLKPHIDLINDPYNWRGTIGNDMNSTQWDEWFVSYEKYILFYAQIAQQTKCELFSVSTELIIVSQQETKWRELVPKIRTVYDYGFLTCSAHWSWPNASIYGAIPTNGSGELTDKRWWDLMDIIGNDNYYINHVDWNSSNPSLNEILSAWIPLQQQMTNLTNYWNKNLIFTEIGYCTGFNGCYGDDNQGPYYPPTNESMYRQYKFYEAALIAMSSYSWFEGIFWWNWATDFNNGGLNDSCLTPSFKPAETLLREWYYATKPPPSPPETPPVCACWY